MSTGEEPGAASAAQASSREQSGAPGLARTVAGNTLHAATGRFASLLVWLVLTPSILHGLGSEGFAVWSLFFAVTGYLAALDFGLAQGTLRHVAAAHERGEEGSGGAFATLAVLGYVILAAVWLVAVLLLRDTLLGWLRIPAEMRGVTAFAMTAGALVFACSGLANVAMAALQGLGRFDVANRVLLVVVAQQAIGIPIVLYAGWGLPGLVVNVGIGWALGFLLGLWRLAKDTPDFRWESPGRSMPHWREALRFGGPIQLANVFTVVHSQLDKFLLPRFVSLAAVTPYELAYRAIIGAFALPQLLVLALIPVAAALHAAGHYQRLRELYVRANRYVLVVAGAALAAALGGADRLFSVWLGAGHADAALALRALAISTALWTATVTAVAVARGIGRTDIEAWFTAVSLVSHTALSLVLLPRYGFEGALVAIVVSNLIGAALMLALLGGALGWPRSTLMLEPLGVPLVSLVAGGTAALAVDRLLPQAHGLLGWLLLALVGGAGAVVAVVVALGTRYVQWQEAVAILRRRSSGATT